MLSKQGLAKPNTMLNYFSNFKSYYINRHLSFKNFNDLQIAFIIKDKKRLFSSKKQNRLLITKNIFKNIIKDKYFFILDLNINTTFKFAQIDLLKKEKLNYIIIKAKKTIFVEISLIKLDISFTKSNKYTILYLKQSKTNIKYIKVQIILQIRNKHIYLITILR